jgi:hypothetical protein
MHASSCQSHRLGAFNGRARTLSRSRARYEFVWTSASRLSARRRFVPAPSTNRAQARVPVPQKPRLHRQECLCYDEFISFDTFRSLVTLTFRRHSTLCRESLPAESPFRAPTRRVYAALNRLRADTRSRADYHKWLAKRLGAPFPPLGGGADHEGEAVSETLHRGRLLGEISRRFR